MSTVYGINQTKLEAGGMSNQCAKGTLDGRLKVRIDQYEAAALVSGDIIEVCGQLPVGAIIHDVVVWTDACGANTAMLVGDSIDNDRYITSTAINTANLKTSLNAIGGNYYTITNSSGDGQLQITMVGPSSATGTINVAVIYSAD